MENGWEKTQAKNKLEREEDSHSVIVREAASALPCEASSCACIFWIISLKTTEKNLTTLIFLFPNQ